MRLRLHCTRSCLGYIAAACILLPLLFYVEEVEQWSSFAPTTNSVSRKSQIGANESKRHHEKEREYHESKADRYCEWMGPYGRNDSSSHENEDQCYPMLLPELQSKRFWYFLGDSTMFYLMTGLEQHFMSSFKKLHFTYLRRQRGRCNFTEYLEMPRAAQWRPPNHTAGEGPTNFGFQKPFCSDCGGCNGRHVSVRIEEQSQSSGTPEKIVKEAEYLPVEFTVDVVLQTPITRTTQETVILYMKKQHENRVVEWNNGTSTNSTELWRRAVDLSVCVVNVGLHDMKLTPLPTKTAYTTRVLNYLGQLEEVCGVFVWVFMSSTLDDEKKPQRNEFIVEWNAAVNDKLQELRPAVYRLDPYHYSQVAPHVDNVHLTDEDYYYPFARLFGNLMDPSVKVDPV